LFREPPINISRYDNNIISPAYGKIYKIHTIDNHVCISIILTVFDVHFQYVPCDGFVNKITYDKNGIFNIVYSDYDKTRLNEKMIYEIKTRNGTVFVYQISGFFFRRILSFLKEKQKVEKGNKLGLITFGSRVDICLPLKNLTLTVSEGDYVHGGETIGFY